MLGRILGFAIPAALIAASAAAGFHVGTMMQPGPADPPEKVRAEAIRRCFLDTSGRFNRTHPDAEVLANINEQCRRLYDER